MFDSNVFNFLVSFFSEVRRFLIGVPIPGTSFTAWGFLMALFCFGAVTMFVKVIFRQHVDEGGHNK